MSEPPSRPPIRDGTVLFEGEMAGRALPELFRWIQPLCSSGSLLLKQGDHQVVLVVHNDLIVCAAGRGAEEDRLGNMIADVGLIEADKVEELAKAQRYKLRRIGEVLVARELIDPAQVAELLDLQIYQRVQRILQWEKVRYVFRARRIRGSGFIGLPLDVACGPAQGLSSSLLALRGKLLDARRNATAWDGTVQGAIWGVWPADSP